MTDPRPFLLRAAEQVAGLVGIDTPLDLPHQVPMDAVADYIEAFAVGRREIAEVWDDTTLERMVTVPWGTVPGRAAAWGYVQEFTVHGWDLATTLGTTDALDPELATTVHGFAREALPEHPRGGAVPFGPVVPVPDDAGPHERLVAWLGRDPRLVRP